MKLKLLFFIFTLFFFIFIYIFEAETSYAIENINNTDTTNTENNLQETKTTRISFAGDCTLGSDLSYGYSGSFMEKYDQVQNFDYFFQNVKSVFANDDFSVVNLEGPLTNSNSKAEKEFAFKGSPEFSGILSAGSIEAVNLANNHTYDYGNEGYQDTTSSLFTAGIGYFGNDINYMTNIDGIDVGFLGYKGFSDTTSLRNQISTDIKYLKDGGADLVVVSFHWGEETSNYPNATQKNLGHYAIDGGADIVIGHHPHVLQGIEEYNGKYIAYSLGNFCFGGNRNPSDKDTIIFQPEFIFDSNNNLIGSDMKIYPCSVSSTKNKNDYAPTILTGSEGERVIERVAKYSEGMIDTNKIMDSGVTEMEPFLPTTTEIVLKVNGQVIPCEPPAYIENGRTLVPLRATMEALNATVIWNEETNEISITTETGDIIKMWIGQENYTINGAEKTMEVVPTIKEGSTFMPIRVVAEATGKNIIWEEETKTVNLLDMD